MDRTKAKLATFFNNDDDEDTSFTKAVDDQKLSQYAQGTARKSKREKEREREQAKKREEEELAAKTYAEFLDAFEGDGARKTAAFVKAGTAQAPHNPSTSMRSGGDGPSRGMDHEYRSVSPPAASAPKPKGKRAMDAFLEEIKRDQAERDARLARHSHSQGRSVTALAAYEGQSGSKDRGDPLTSNVFVANLPAHVTEMSLGNFFASRCGPVGSVKIMWPRSDATQGPGSEMTASRSRKNAGLTGFVSFMKRKDAETAVHDVDGYDWGGYVLRVGWSKAVPLAAKAAYVATRNSRSRSRSRDRHQGGDRGPDRYDKGFSRSLSRDRYRSRSRSRSNRHTGGRHRSDSRSYSPRDRRRRSHSRDRDSRSYRRRSYDRSYSRSHSYSRSRSRGSRSPRRRNEKRRTGVDPDTEKFIATVASKVKEHGEPFEDVLRERERDNSRFAFLFDTSLPENRLYRALLAGDELIVGFDDEGYNSIYSTDSGEESERERVRKTKLGKLARKRFEAMLRALSGRRGDVARCMAFCLEHAEAASEVADIIVASLVVDDTPVPRKVARLHLICDILHNSAVTVPHAWKFRQEFQSRLGIVFDHLSSIYHSFPGRITAETFKKQIMAIIDTWEDWIVFTPDYTAALKSRLEGASENVTSEEKATQGGQEDGKVEEVITTATSSKFTASSFRPTMEPLETTASKEDRESDMEVDSDEELQGKGSKEKVNSVEDVDGEPMDDVDGEPIDDIDGEPLGGEDIDGDPIDGENIDGEPLDGEPLDGEALE